MSSLCFDAVIRREKGLIRDKKNNLHRELARTMTNPQIYYITFIKKSIQL